MKIFLHIQFDNLVKHDFLDPSLGNPGIGGTEYATISLATELAKNNLYEVSLFSNVPLKLHPSVSMIHANDFQEASMDPQVRGEFLIFRPKIDIEKDTKFNYENSKAKLIAWTHVTPSPAHLRLLAETSSIAAVVALGRRQYFSWVDNPVAKKTYIIQNGQYPARFLSSNSNELVVTYLGALVPQKGFHELAKIWPKISRSYPHATLQVIGSGSLYKDDQQLGDQGLAQPAYERKILDLLGKDISSVAFLGKLSAHEKAAAISKTLIGVVNPTGNTENCPASALDFQAAGVPVVSARKYGVIDTVLDGVTGILIRSPRNLEYALVRLIEDSNLRLKMSRNAKFYVDQNFEFGKILKQWDRALEKISNGDPDRNPGISKSKSFGEVLAILNANNPIKSKINVKWPTIVEIKTKIKSFRVRLV